MPAGPSYGRYSVGSRDERIKRQARGAPDRAMTRDNMIEFSEELSRFLDRPLDIESGARQRPSHPYTQFE